jgi:hypothetical protein
MADPGKSGLVVIGFNRVRIIFRHFKMVTLRPGNVCKKSLPSPFEKIPKRLIITDIHIPEPVVGMVGFFRSKWLGGTSEHKKKSDGDKKFFIQVQ